MATLVVYWLILSFVPEPAGGATLLFRQQYTEGYTLVAGGYGLVAFAIVYWLVDIKGKRAWTPPFVACAFLPGSDHPQLQNLARQGSVDELTAVGWIEQIAPGEFQPHELKKGSPSHVTLDSGDYDGDGDVDIVLGNFVGFTFGKADTGFTTDTWVEVWENRTPRPGEAATASR